jgi:aminoglycoside N3'-acetyltransferase
MNNSPEFPPVSRREIEAGLRKLGLLRGAAAVVHASLSRFGRVEGGAAAVVDALMNVVGSDGTLVMPAYPLSKPLPLTEAERKAGLLAKVEIFDESHSGPSGMGKIADEFRGRPGIVLGRGIHRLCAWGREAGRHSRGLEHLLDADGLVLLLGVGIDRCSCMHLAEGKGLPAAVAECFRVPEDLRRRYPANIHLAYGKTPQDGWAKIQEIAERRGLMNAQTIGKAPCLSFKAKSVVDIYRAALQTDPLGLFGIPEGTTSDGMGRPFRPGGISPRPRTRRRRIR